MSMLIFELIMLVYILINRLQKRGVLLFRMSMLILNNKHGYITKNLYIKIKIKRLMFHRFIWPKSNRFSLSRF